jgi:deoxyribodipyrimidine photo-lyase
MIWRNSRNGVMVKRDSYLHNRLRMVAASFLTKHLLVDYRLGEQYFAAKLLDYDLSANNGGWQWAASTGCDSQPYFRVFNPTLQSEKFDPEARFIKKMLPIFAKIEAKYIHNPSDYKEELAEAGIVLGEDYPEPIVNHKEARQHTLDLFKEFIANNI